jgi:hypothetical protein
MKYWTIRTGRLGTSSGKGIWVARRCAWTVTAVLAALLIAPAPAQAAEGLAYIVGRQETLTGLGAEQLYTVDLATGEATLVGRLGLAETLNVGGLAIAEDGTLYGIADSPFDPSIPDSLHVIDTATGAATLIGSLGQAVVATGSAFGADGTLWYSGALPQANGAVGQFGSLNPATAAATAINAADPDLITSGLAAPCEETATIFGIATSTERPTGIQFSLTRIETATGTSTPIGPTGLWGDPLNPISASAAPDIAFEHASGTLYGVYTDMSSYPQMIYGVFLQTFDTATGAASGQPIRVDGTQLYAAVDAITIDAPTNCPDPDPGPSTSPSTPSQSASAPSQGPSGVASLPSTGSSTWPIALSATMLILLGVILAVALQRRGPRTPFLIRGEVHGSGWSRRR